jgi:hypothetical protein
MSSDEAKPSLEHLRMEFAKGGSIGLTVNFEFIKPLFGSGSSKSR